MKVIRESRDTKLILDFGNNKKYDVIAIPVVQFIFFNFKANGLLCDRKVGNLLTMQVLCCDYDISLDDGDNICIGKQLTCSFHHKENIAEK